MFGRYCILSGAFALAACASVDAEDAPRVASTIPIDQQAFLDTCDDWDEWDKPAPPFKVYGNTYYVGTCGIAVILNSDATGVWLIDTGTDEGARIVLENIRSIEIDPRDIAVIRMSHEHYDHIGGIARMQAATGAAVVSSEAAKPVLESGLPSANDPQAASDHPAFTPVKSGITVIYPILSEVNDSLTITPYWTPGHSPGALSWQWESCEEDDCKTIVYADSMGPVSSDEYRFSDHPEYLAEYRKGIQRVRELECDILLTPHPSASNMLERMKSGTLEDGMTCIEYAGAVERRLNARLEREASATE